VTYQTYTAQMRGLRKTPMSEKQFNSMMGIETEISLPPLQIRPRKNAKKVDATHKNYEVTDGN